VPCPRMTTTFKAFHSTPQANQESIEQSGFRPSAGDFGTGVYFTLDRPDKFYTRLGSVVFECDVAPVKVLDVETKEGARELLREKVSCIETARSNHPTCTAGVTRRAGIDEFTIRLREQGYDAVLIRDPRITGSSPYLVVLDPTRIGRCTVRPGGEYL